MGKMIEFDRMMELIFALSESDLAEFEYEGKEERIRIKKHARPEEPERRVIFEEKKDAEPSKEISVEEGCLVKSPMVGIFYGIEGIVPGKWVEKGQLLGNIEAMKLMNEIKSEQEGVLEEIFVKDGQAVEYGQPMFLIK